MNFNLAFTKLFLCFFVSTAAAQSTPDGLQALRKKDYTTALEIFKTEAGKGDGGAMYLLATMYRDGKGVTKNLLESSYWAIKSAETGDVNGLNLGGLALILGAGGIKKDEARGIEYLNQASIKGNISATRNLGHVYFKGIGVPVDYIKAREFLERSSLGNTALPHYYLGRIYDSGLGVTKDQARALREFKIALSKVKDDEKDSDLKQPLRKSIEERIASSEKANSSIKPARTNPNTDSHRNHEQKNDFSTDLKLEDAKKKCESLGFKKKTESFGECVLKISE